MKKKILFLILIIFSANNAKADEIFRFTRITCIPELNYFDASVIEINSRSDKEKDILFYKQKELQKKYNIFGEKIKDVQECKLEKANIKVWTDHDLKHGDAKFKMWIDDRLVINLKHFYAYDDYYSTARGIAFKWGEDHDSILYINIASRKYVDPQIERSCAVFFNIKTKKINFDNCKYLKENQHLLIKDDYIFAQDLKNK